MIYNTYIIYIYIYISFIHIITILKETISLSYHGKIMVFTHVLFFRCKPDSETPCAAPI